MDRTDCISRALAFWSRLMVFSFTDRSRSRLNPSLSLSRMSKVMSMASSIGVFGSWGVGVSVLGFVIMGVGVGGAGGGTGLDGGVFTGAGCG